MTIAEQIRQLKSKIELLKDKNMEIASQYPVKIKNFYEWNRLNGIQRAGCKEKWDKYYSEVKDSPIYALFLEQRSENTSRVKELAQQAKEMSMNKDFVVSIPICVNPYEVMYDSSINCFRENLKKIDIFNQQLKTFSANDYGEQLL